MELKGIQVASPAEHNKENWQERAEVLTKPTHKAYQTFAKELVADIVEKVPSESSKPFDEFKSPHINKFKKRVFAAIDSDSGKCSSVFLCLSLDSWIH